MTKDELIALAKQIAQEKGLDPALVCAVVEQESDWDTWAVRYEPDFDKRYLVPMHLRPTEEICRAMSWGLMQVMGETAVEHGFTPPSVHLLEPAIGLAFGCIVLGLDIFKADGVVRDGLLRYNGGRDAAYPDQVMARMAKYQT